MIMKESMMSELARSPEQLGNTIRRARKKRGMSQSELGEKAGLRQETISLIENGNPAAKFETILAVLSALGLEFQINERAKQSMVEDALSKLMEAMRSDGKK
jgi:HTH-type transcriptional regulator/antitoxin HipB